MDTDRQVVTIGKERQVVTIETLTRKENIMPKMKQHTKPFTLVPQVSVDASLALCRDVIIIIITVINMFVVTLKTDGFSHLSTLMTYTYTFIQH